MKRKCDDNENVSMKVSIRLSLQRALLGEVASSLRMVTFDWNEEEDTIFLFFYFDGRISDENIDSASCVAAEVAGDFDEYTRVIEEYIRLDFPQTLPTRDFPVYVRKEC